MASIKYNALRVKSMFPSNNRIRGYEFSFVTIDSTILPPIFSFSY